MFPTADSPNPTFSEGKRWEEYRQTSPVTFYFSSKGKITGCTGADHHRIMGDWVIKSVIVSEKEIKELDRKDLTYKIYDPSRFTEVPFTTNDRIIANRYYKALHTTIFGEIGRGEIDGRTPNYYLYEMSNSYSNFTIATMYYRAANR